MIRLAALFSCVGVAVPFILIAIWKTGIAPSGALTTFFLVLWPASFGLMALQGAKPGEVLLTYSVLIAANGVLYGVIGLLVGLLKRITTRPAA